MKSSKLVCLVVISMLAVAIGVLPTPTQRAEAATLSWSGSLQAPDPTWDRVNDFCSGAEGTIEWYDVQPFWVDTSGSYTLVMTALAGTVGPDGYFALYQTSFNPAAQATNCLVADDDSNFGSVGFAPRIITNLTAYTPYILVTTQCCDGTSPGQEINYTNTISGPGAIAFGAPPPVTNLVASATCNALTLQVTITAGDGTLFNITGTGPGLPANNVAFGTTTLTGPGVWNGVTVTEVGGDQQSVSLGNFNCSTPLNATVSCVGTNLQVSITGGDGPFNITGTGPGLPNNGVATGTNTLTGPGVWTGVTVTETTGDLETTNLGNFNCSTAVAASVICVGDNLQLTITTGDTPMNLSGTGPGLPVNGLTLGTSTLTGPGTWTGLTLTEAAGDLEVLNLGTVNCSTTSLTVSAVCAGDNLLLSILAGDGPFNITGTGPGLPLNGAALGTLTLIGPSTWSNMVVTETTGNLQAYTVPNMNCIAAGIPVPNLGLVMITGDQAQPAYNTPNGLIAHASNGAEIWLPADADGNWYDTYVVADVQEVAGEIWLGLFIGNTNWGYVRLADVTVLVPIQGLE